VASKQPIILIDEIVPPPALIRAGLEALPSIIRAQGERASRRFIEFFTANIRNRNTRMAYARAVKQFFDWCDKRKLELNDIEALSVAASSSSSASASKPTVKQHLAAIRKLFDYLTTGGILEHNPASSVRGPKYVVRRDKTPVLSAEEARKLLTGLDRDDDIDRAARPGSHRGHGLQFRPGRSNGDDAGRRLFPAS
jgi:integrase